MEEENNKSKSAAKSRKTKSGNIKKVNNVNKRLKKDTKEKLSKAKDEEIIIDNIQLDEVKEKPEKKTQAFPLLHLIVYYL